MNGERKKKKNAECKKLSYTHPPGARSTNDRHVAIIFITNVQRTIVSRKERRICYVSHSFLYGKKIIKSILPGKSLCLNVKYNIRGVHRQDQVRFSRSNASRRFRGTNVLPMLDHRKKKKKVTFVEDTSNFLFKPQEISGIVLGKLVT